MTSVHFQPEKHGIVFGVVTVTIDTDVGDCMLRVDAPGFGGRRPRFHSLDEIRGAYLQQNSLAGSNPIARDMAKALEYAGKTIKAAQEERRR